MKVKIIKCFLNDYNHIGKIGELNLEQIRQWNDKLYVDWSGESADICSATQVEIVVEEKKERSAESKLEQIKKILES